MLTWRRAPLDCCPKRGGRAPRRVRQLRSACLFTFGWEPPADDRTDGHYAYAKCSAAGIELRRDELGVAPPYYGAGVTPYFHIRRQTPLDAPATQVVTGLRQRLDGAVGRRTPADLAGAWLSGGLDSSAIAALVRPKTDKLHTFAAGLPGAPDSEFAAMVARHVGSEHHECVASLPMLLDALPRVIYHLESFDALLVRSSLMHFLAGNLASDYVSSVFSGDGGDELLAGYDYLKRLDTDMLDDELVGITGRLHNTALQRVDRRAAAPGLVAHVPFADAEVLQYALRVPVEMKLRGNVEKWVLRQALAHGLPEPVVNRTKAKFWQGAGVDDLLAEEANRRLSAADYEREMVLRGGQVLRSKGELMYYRIFRHWFGDLTDLDWMGRTKSAPKDSARR